MAASASEPPHVLAPSESIPRPIARIIHTVAPVGLAAKSVFIISAGHTVAPAPPVIWWPSRCGASSRCSTAAPRP